MQLDGFFINNEQWAVLDKLGRDLTWWPDGSDAMRDIGHKLWYLLDFISKQRISVRVPVVEESEGESE